MRKTMLTTATQQRNSQDNLQGNPQSETPPISIETSPIAPIIDAARIFSLRFTVRMKRISAILIMSILMVFLAACAGGGGGGGGGDVTPSGGDTDNDGVRNNVDVDADGDGLIEIATAQQFNQARHNLQGSSLKINATDTGDANGCGGQSGITACNGYELTNDISLADYADWQPIGSCPTYDDTTFTCTDTAALFSATFHGNDRTISNLAITNSNGLYANASGLFGAISTNSVLRNIHIRSANITGVANGVGMLVGYAREATIKDSSVEGDVTASGSNVGGLVGLGDSATITLSYAESDSVDGGEDVGGLVGSGEGATITLSYAESDSVDGGEDVGGLVGDGQQATITSSYAVGVSVSGTANVGGLVGDGQQVTITSSYTVGVSVSGTANVSGLVGNGDDSTGITASYWDDAVTISGATAGSYGSSKSTAELQAPVHATGIYTTWSSLCPGTNRPAWYFGNSTQYPVLTCPPNSDSDRDGVPDITDTDDDNDGILDTADALPLNPTESVDTDNDGIGDNADACDVQPDGLTDWRSDALTDPDGDGCRSGDQDDDDDGDRVRNNVDIDANGNGLIEIATAQQLNQTRYNLQGSSFKINAIDAGDSTGCGGQSGITACNGYELTNDISLADYADWQPIGSCSTYSVSICADPTISTTTLFDTIFDGKGYTISNLTITNSQGDYDNEIGLFGAVSFATQLRHINIRSANINGGVNNAGMLVGYAQGASIINSTAIGEVTATGDNVGGLVGSGQLSTIISSYAAGGNVSGDNLVGGLVGAGSGTITSSYTEGGNVNGAGVNVGGLVGSWSGSITSSYAAGGAVSGVGINVGGLVGQVGHGTTIMSSYAAGGAVSGFNYVGALVGAGAGAIVMSSYAVGVSVSGTTNVGGLVGDGRGATITSSYAVSVSVSGTANVGGLVGNGDDSTGITASYWDDAVTISGATAGSYGSSKSTAELQAPVHAIGIYATWSSLCPGTNKPAWYFGNSTQYPVLTCPPNSDSDRDGVPDIIDTDDDNDGILDTADDLPLNPTEDTDTDGDGVGNNTDTFPSDPNESVDTDGDRVGDNADNCPLVPNNGQDDFDNDVVGDACDVDTNGNGLIEIATAQQLNQTRYNLQGSSFKISATAPGDANGCGGQDGITACNGYELTQNISLADYANWQPIGSCSTYSVSICADPTISTTTLFNTIFDGKGYTISNLTITNSQGDYDNEIGLFGAVSFATQLRNINIRSANINGGVNNAGMLVGYARGASIINSTAIGEVTATGDYVGGLVGYGERATIMSSYAAGGTVSGVNWVGGLVGAGSGSITSSYTEGRNVDGSGFNVGGLAGAWSGSITSSYAAGGAVSGVDINVGGLVGQVGDGTTIMSSYAAGGAVSGTNFVGGLVGVGTGSTITASYWDDAVTISGATAGSYGSSKSTAELQAPVHAIGIYATWTSLCPGTNKPAWYFGNSTQYPVLTCHPNSDSDRDGAPDIIDTDDDNDGILDTADDLPLNPTESVDTDNDGVGNNADACDGVDAATDWTSNTTTDMDGDGCRDSDEDAFPDNRAESVDTDGDTVGDNADACDGVDAATGWTSNTTTDMDGDGCRDSDEDAFPNNPTESVDTDGDTVGDNADAFPNNAAESVDTDSDGIGDNADNCLLVPNNGQGNFDNDVMGDACDIDANGNGLIDIHNAITLDQVREDLTGRSFAGNSVGCGGQNTGIMQCNGYELVADISLAGYNDDSWQPIGSCLELKATGVCTSDSALFFNTTFDGNGYTISNLTITITDPFYTYTKGAGLFGAISPDSVLRNIHIRSANITGVVIVTVDDVSTGVVTNVGLLVGYAQGATISNSSAEGEVTASGGRVGGLVGYGRDATITSSYAVSGNVNGRDRVGGLVGDGQGATITSSYAESGTVSGSDSVGGNVGGLVGFGLSANITSSYAVSGDVSGILGVGGLVGGGQSATITSSYADSGTVSGDTRIGGLVGSGWLATITSSNATGRTVSGTGNYVGGLVGYGLKARITSSYAAGGTVSGNNWVGGLVGLGKSSTITSSYAAGGNVSGIGNNVGGLIGYGELADIMFSYAEKGTVSGVNMTGGLVGDGRTATITSSYASIGTVNGIENHAGGLVGIGWRTTITSSYASVGTVSGVNYLGGLVAFGHTATITSSYAEVGTVSGTGNIVGGLVGDGRFATVSSSYAVSGTVSGTGNVGGLVGLGDTNTMTPNSYWDNAVNIMGTPDTRSYGTAQTTSALHTGTGGIYTDWTTTCTDGSPTWDFGTTSQYPAITCTPDDVEDQR